MDTVELQNLIKELIQKMDISVKNIQISQDDGSKTLWYSVEVSEPHLFLGREGDALAALNHLVRRILEKKEPLKEEGPSVLVDIGGFQKKKVENVKAIAYMMAERARYFKSSIEVDPMSAFDRRIIHEFLSAATDLKTESTGFGPTRRVVIKYVGELS